MMTALIVLVVAVVVGGLILRQFVFLDVVPAKVQIVETEIANERKTAVRATMTDCRKHGKSVRVEGLVHNLGSTILSAVTVQSIWKDDEGMILDTGLVYAVGESEPLLPGEQRAFTDSTALQKVARCNVRPLDWWSSD